MRVALLFLMLCSVPMTLGLSISHEYLPDKELVLTPGEDYVFTLIVENEEAEDMTVNVTMDSEVATLVGGGLVTIPAQTYNKAIYFDIAIPDDPQPTYQLRYRIEPANPSSFSEIYDRTITVRVKQENMVGGAARIPEEQAAQTNWLLWPLLAIVVAGLFVMTLHKSARLRKAKELKTDTQPNVMPQPKHATEMLLDVHIVEKALPETPKQPANPATGPLVAEAEPQTNPVTVARARPEHAFRLADGRKIFTVLELLHVLEKYPGLCHEHIGRGDFAHWLRDELQLPDLADLVAEQTTTAGVASVLNNALA